MSEVEANVVAALRALREKYGPLGLGAKASDPTVIVVSVPDSEGRP